jgi:membrane protein
LLVSLTLETLLRGLADYLKNVMPGGHIVALALFLIFDLAVIVPLFAMIFRYLPDAKIGWSDVWIGATLTAVLFALGKSGRLRRAHPQHGAESCLKCHFANYLAQRFARYLA